MGSGIAQIASTQNLEVVLIDRSQQPLEKSRSNLNRIVNRLVEKNKIDQALADQIEKQISYSQNIEQAKGSDLVLEAIVEDLNIKQTLFKELEGIVSKDCILASNTSSLSIASIASVLQYKERFLGLHFFNPAPLMPLVEVIGAVTTSPECLNYGFELMQNWKKVPVYAKDTPGFIVNKVARPFYGEALRIYDEGIADFKTIDMAMKTVGGFRMGPFELMDFIGNDINYKVTETVFKAFYNDARYKPSFTQKRLAEAGLLGRKTGRGYYDYSLDQTEETTPDKQLLETIFMRIISMLVNEAYDTLFWNIATKEHIELAMRKGVNYPKGLFAWAKEIGVQNIVDQLEQLYSKYQEERYRISPLLKEDVKA